MTELSSGSDVPVAEPQPRPQASRTPKPGAQAAVFAAAPLAAVALFLLFAVRAGLPALHAVQAALAVAVTQVIPGMLLWRLLRPRRGWWFEDVVMGFALGACTAVAIQTLAGILGQAWLTWVGGPATAAAVLAGRTTRRRITAATTERLPVAWAWATSAVALLLIVPTQRFYRQIPLDWTEGFRASYPDIPFHLAVAGQLAHRGPTEIPYVLGEPLDYHWFSHAWIAQVSVAGGVPLDEVLVRFMPALFAVLAVFIIAAAAMRLSGRFWTGPLAALIAVAAGDLDVIHGARAGSLVNPLSPSLGFAVVVTVALLALLGARWREATGPAAVAGIVLLTATAAGAKGSALPVVVAGVCLTFVVAWLAKWPDRRVITLDTAVVLATSLTFYVLLFRGRTGGLRLDPLESLAAVGSERLLVQGAQVGSALLLTAAVVRLVGVLARGAGLLAPAVLRPLRQDPALPLLIGAGLAGAAGVVLLAHPGQSQWYFLRNAGPALAIGSAIGLAALWDALRDHRAFVLGWGVIVGLTLLVVQAYGFGGIPSDGDIAGAVLARVAASATVLIVGIVAAWLAASRSGAGAPGAVAVVSVALVLSASVPAVLDQMQEPLPPFNRSVAPDTPLAFSRDQIEAARWLRDHSHRDDVIATNRHCAKPDADRCDSRRFYVAAYSERRVLVEGWAYTRSWSESPEVPGGKLFKPFWDAELLALNDGFLQSPSDADAAQLYERGVRWLFLDKTGTYAADLASYSGLRYETEWALVLQLEPPPA